MWSERTPGHPVRLLSRRLLLIVVLVRCCSVQDAESYTWPERVVLLDSVTTVVPIGHSRSTSSRGGVVSVFARGFNVLATGGVVPILSCMENIELWCVGAVQGFCFGHASHGSL